MSRTMTYQSPNGHWQIHEIRTNPGTTPFWRVYGPTGRTPWEGWTVTQPQPNTIRIDGEPLATIPAYIRSAILTAVASNEEAVA